MRARHVIPSISIRTTRYVIKKLLAVKSVVVVLSQIEEWCFPLHFTQDLLLRHAEAQCLVSVQLKHNFFLESISLCSSISLTVVSGFMPRFLTINIVTVLIIFIICLINIFTFETFLTAWNYFRISDSSLF